MPDEFLLGHFRAEVTSLGTHVAVQEFEPGAGKRVGKLGRVLMEAPRNFFVGGIDAQGDIRREHKGRVAPGRIVRIGYGVGTATILGLPLVRSGGALGQLPFETKKVIEIVVGPLRGLRGPGTFEAAGNGIAAVAAAIGVFPPLAHLFDVRPGGFRTHVFDRVGSAVGFAEGVTARNQRDGFFVVHGHAAKSLADVVGRR